MKAIQSDERFSDLRFPLAGIDLSTSLTNQPYRPVAGGVYAPTTPGGVNVRAYEPGTDRARGAARQGLVKWIRPQVNGLWIVQDLNLLVHTGVPVQTNQAGRIVSIVAVSQGNVFSAQPGDTVWTAAVNASTGTPPLNITGVIFSTPIIQKLWFADGVNYRFFDPTQNKVFDWVASAGTLPVDSGNNTPRLICTWRGRCVLSGLLLDPQDWFMSAVNDPTNFDYAPLSVTPTQAIAGINAPQGLVGDIVTALVPYTDDVLIFGGDHTIYMMAGDPMSGGQIDLISDSIGMAFGIPWAKDPFGNLYFFSSRTGIYTLIPGQQPIRISQGIEQLLQATATGSNSIRLIWDDTYQGLHVFITPLAAPGPTTHFFFEQRSGAWWTDQFANHNQDPIACCVADGNLPSDRIVLIGSWDGYVRKYLNTAPDDDGTPIASTVILGPILTKDLDEMLLKDLQAVLATTSGTVSYAVYVGASPEDALNSQPVLTGTWGPGRNLLNLVRRSGHAVYVQLTSTVPWSMEAIRARIAGSGKVRRRGH